MFPNHHDNIPSLSDQRIRPDRRHVPTQSEIRLRIKRALQGA
jgi:hypothetical protein